MTVAMYWIAAMIVLVIIECISVGLTSIWFACGALVAAISAALGASIPVQIGVFIAVSIVLLCLTRPWAKKYLNSRVTKTNADSMVGEFGIVTIDVNNLKAEGQIQVKGSYWTARSESDEPILKGTKVEIKQINGVTVIVAPATK